MGSGVVRERLGDRSLYIGNRLAARRDDGPSFAAVLTLSHEREPLTTHHHPLDDGPDNDPAAVAAAVDTARALHRERGSILVHCAAGVSRSATVLAATVAAEERLLFHDGLGVVQRHRRRACPHPALRQAAREYLRAADERPPTTTDPGPAGNGDTRGNRDQERDRLRDRAPAVAAALRQFLR